MSSLPQTLFVSVLEMHGYVVGRANAPSGLHRFDGNWVHIGWRNTRCNGFAFDPSRADVLFLACGNGVFRTPDGGRTWRVTTGWEITDVMDVTVDLKGHVLVGTAYGIWRSEDDGESWQPSANGIPTPLASYTSVIEADLSREGRVLTGGASGLFLSTNGGVDWGSVGPSDVEVRDLRQSRTDPDLWLAATDGKGLLISRDGGRRWEALGDNLHGIPFYSVAVDPNETDRMATGGYGTHVLTSSDGGKSWSRSIEDLPQANVHGLAFDLNGALWAGTVGAGVFVSDGSAWRPVGLHGGTIVDMSFAG